MPEQATEQKAQATQINSPKPKTMPQGVLIALIVVGGLVIVGLLFSTTAFYARQAVISQGSNFTGFTDKMHERRDLRIDDNRKSDNGTVTAINNDSLTIKTHHGEDVTLKIVDSTSISNREGIIKATDIKVGDTVSITAKTTDENTAARITRP